jgi:phage-related protein
MLVDAAIEIVMALAFGIIDALPRLIDKVPVIITKLVTALVNNLPKLIEAGIQLIIALAGGLVKAIPQLISKIPEIITSIVNGFGNYYSKLSDIGKNLMKGVWEGIQSMATWLKDRVTGFFNGLVTGIKNILGIKSPSRVFAGIGENMALGLGAGFDDEMDSVTRKINSSIPTSIDIPANRPGRGGVGGAGATYIYLDSRVLTTATGRKQSTRNQAFSRAVGVPV